MTNWILLGGCLLGLFGVEWARQVLFPGETPLWGWRWGRTRRQEKLKGGGSVSRITPQFALSPDQILPGYSKWAERLESQPPMEVEESLRKKLFETKDRIPRLLLTGLLAQASLQLGNREEAHALLEEAEENLRSNWINLDPVFLFVAERIAQTKALIFFQEGNCPIVLDILSEAERLFGKKEWMQLLKAEIHLLQGGFIESIHLLEPMIDRVGDRSSNANANRLNSTIHALLGESYLRSGDWENLERVLAVASAPKAISPHDEAAILRLKLEVQLQRGDIEAAKGSVKDLEHLAKKCVGHRGLARCFHVACSRVEVYQGNAIEALRRLQLAENECRYPAALWEVNLCRAFILESEDRFEDAIQVWRSLIKSAPGTFFGKIAQTRIAMLAEAKDPTPSSSLHAEIA
ncbi:MAG: hypothetical protein KC994_18625 [Candidatus Omnitrophica bacterium]|nr:hypothetical protein [Candidatus Omnitrophota bacterium]